METIFPKNSSWNIRRSVDESFVPMTQQPSVFEDYRILWWSSESRIVVKNVGLNLRKRGYNLLKNILRLILFYNGSVVKGRKTSIDNRTSTLWLMLKEYTISS